MACTGKYLKLYLSEFEAVKSLISAFRYIFDAGCGDKRTKFSHNAEALATTVLLLPIYCLIADDSSDFVQMRNGRQF